MATCNCVYEDFCSMLNGKDIALPKPCEYRKDNSNYVEVIRCKDCVYISCYPVSDWSELRCRFHDRDTQTDDYCSYGERSGAE